MVAGARRTLVAVVAATTTAQMWTQVHAVETKPGSGEGDAKRAVGEEEPMDALGEDLVGGELSYIAPTSANTIAPQKDSNAEALVLVTDSPSTAPGSPNGAENPVKEPMIDLDTAIGNGQQGTTATTTESPTTEAPTKPAAVVGTTTKPSLRTQVPGVISNAVTSETDDSQDRGYLSQGNNPFVLVALAGICCIFLFVWGRKRRSSATSTSSSSGGAGSKGSKVQYTQVPDEQPFSHSQDDDDDEYCDDYEEDTFANDRDNWDDWEGNSTQTQSSNLNPFAATPSALRPTSPLQSNSTTFTPAQRLPPPPQQQHVQLQEIAIASQGDLLPSSVESNSSSDSFEVVTEEAHAPPTSSGGASTDAEKESESVDDLFSQFGMVPTFKKSAVVQPPPAATSAAPASATAAPSSVSSLPTAAEVSALFAAEMDDELTVADAADEWGEDDEWVKGI